MKDEKSFGIIPLKFSNNGWEVLITQHIQGHWAFPKGHAEKGELPKETAERELKEETQLDPKNFLIEETLQENYTYQREGEKINKVVIYFLAEVSGEVSLQKEEVIDAMWIKVEKAIHHVTFPEAKNICRKLEEILL